MTNAGLVIVIFIATAVIFVVRRKLCKQAKQHDNNSHNSYYEINPYDEIIEDQGGVELPVLNGQENEIIAFYCPHSRETQNESEPHIILNNGVHSIHSYDNAIVPLVNMDTARHWTQLQEDLTRSPHFTVNASHSSQSMEVLHGPLRSSDNPSLSKDGYLNPYMSLNADRNDYLLPYSTIPKAKQCVRKLSNICLTGAKIDITSLDA